jgi:hypothetical protein
MITRRVQFLLYLVTILLSSDVCSSSTGNSGLHKIVHNIPLMAVYEGPGKCEERNERIVSLLSEARNSMWKLYGQHINM